MIIDARELSDYINNLKIVEEFEDGEVTLTGSFLVPLEEVIEYIGAYIEYYEELPTKATLIGVTVENINDVTFKVDETTLFQEDFETKIIDRKTFVVFKPTTAYC